MANKRERGQRHTREDETIARAEKVIKEANKLAEVDLDLLIDYAEAFVMKNLRNVKTHQIRRFFDSIKKIQSSGNFTNREKAKLFMLRPQLINASARQNRLKELATICTTMIKKVDSQSDFRNFANFFESLVAFHNAYSYRG